MTEPQRSAPTAPASDSDSIPYIGQELALFAGASHWKSYWTSRVRPFMRGDVLEVGAGAGANTRLLVNPVVRSWTCLEPDAHLAMRCRQAMDRVDGLTLNVAVGTTQSLALHASFDAILYVDVLEHVQDDVLELARAARLLRSGGHLVVLSPAHPVLFSPFDGALGHFRRYTRRTLVAAAPRELRLIELIQLDAVGMAASLANRLVLRQVIPTPRQVRFWDTCLVRLSRALDPLLGYRLGRSILAVWEA